MARVRLGWIVVAVVAVIAVPTAAQSPPPIGAVARCGNGAFVLVSTGPSTCQDGGGVAEWLSPPKQVMAGQAPAPASAAPGLACSDWMMTRLNPDEVLAWSPTAPPTSLRFVSATGLASCTLSAAAIRPIRERAVRFRALDFNPGELWFARQSNGRGSSNAVAALAAYAQANGLNDVYEEAITDRPVATIKRCGEALVAAQYDETLPTSMHAWKREADRVCATPAVVPSTASTPGPTPAAEDASVAAREKARRLAAIAALAGAIAAGPRSGYGAAAAGAADGLVSGGRGVPSKPFLPRCFKPVPILNSFADMKQSMEYLTCEAENQSKLAQWRACAERGESVCRYR